MANSKEFTLGFEAGGTVYLSVQRRADGYLLDDADGAFRVPPVTDFAIAMSANSYQPSLYEAAEARTAWADGVYLVMFYLQLGGSPAPTTDPILASKDMTLVSDEEVTDGGSTTITSSSTSTTVTTEGDLADLKKMVKAILHDNKMVLDKVSKGSIYGNGNADQKESGLARGRNR